MIIVTTSGGTRRVSGWRAWALGVAMVLVAWCMLAAMAVFAVGLGLTIGLGLLVALPALAIVGFARSWMASGARQGPRG